MASELEINRLPGLFVAKMIWQRSALTTNWHTSSPPPPTSGGSDKLEPKSVLRVDHHWWEDWVFRAGFMFHYTSYTRFSRQNIIQNLFCAIEITTDRDKWSEIPISATTVYTSGQMFLSSTCMGAVDNQQIATRQSIAKLKKATPRRIVLVKPNQSWWWPFSSPTQERGTHILSLHDSHWLNRYKSSRLGQGKRKH